MNPESSLWEFGQRLMSVRGRLEPKSPEGLYLLEIDWSRPPYPHEKLLVSTWVFFVEKQALGRSLDQEDLENLAFIFAWILSLRPGQVNNEKLSGKRNMVPLLEKGSFEEIKTNLDNLGENDFFAKEGQERLMMFIRGSVLRLVEAGIFVPPGEKNLRKIEKKIVESAVEIGSHLPGVTGL